MSDERFDDHIKKQLESVKPPYKKEAWKNFQKLLPAPWYVKFYKQYTPWIYGGAAGVVMLVTTLLYFRENKENQQLHDTISTLKTRISENETNPVRSPEQDAGTKVSADTLHNLSARDTTWIREKSRVSPVDGINKPAGEKPESPNALIETPQAGKAIDRRKRTTIPPGENRETGKRADRLVAAEKPGRSRSVSTAIVPESLPGQAVNLAGNRPGNAGQISPVAAPGAPIKAPLADKDVTGADTLQAIGKAVADSAAGEATDNTASSKWKRIFGGLQGRIGGTADFKGGNKMAGGPVAEILLGPGIGVSTGLLFWSPDQQQHAGPRDFDKATGRRFEEDYRRHIPHHDRIERIKVKTTIVSLPLTLYYYFPSPGKLSFFVNGGTILDLKAYQSVEFRSTFQGEDRVNRFADKTRPRTFNQVLLGVGGQYRFGRLVGQVSPYIDLKFRDPDYFNRKGRFGLNTSIKFNLKK